MDLVTFLGNEKGERIYQEIHVSVEQLQERNRERADIKKARKGEIKCQDTGRRGAGDTGRTDTYNDVIVRRRYSDDRGDDTQQGHGIQDEEEEEGKKPKTFSVAGCSICKNRERCRVTDEITEELYRGDRRLVWISTHLWLAELVKTSVSQHSH
ncbi:hypothetical protein EYF80_011083 [Liparis tanakae]|uniref:Uncharacterized protein n=1 Tax=Liparis tanakae TaxID=230148 RepID=A0A4Z2IKY9_9TELE|nr:hypothetical protein EYF80_011083 [Liparis tanakae]